jgi:hypothetical protein
VTADNKVEYKPNRAIKAEEHFKIIGYEKNPERKSIYELCWHIEALQSDVANLTAEEICWRSQTLSFLWMKTKQNSTLAIGKGLEALMRNHRSLSYSVKAALGMCVYLAMACERERTCSFS